MTENERVTIIESLRVVDHVVLSVDKDRTVCQTLQTMKPTPDIFCNAGDQTNDAIPERAICKKMGIDLMDGLGEKIQSSSLLIENAQYISKKNK